MLGHPLGLRKRYQDLSRFDCPPRVVEALRVAIGRATSGYYTSGAWAKDAYDICRRQMSVDTFTIPVGLEAVGDDQYVEPLIASHILLQLSRIEGRICKYFSVRRKYTY
jgi:hypothetical protein